MACLVAFAAFGCAADLEVPHPRRLDAGASSGAARRYTTAELTAALPRGTRQLHGFRVEEACRSFAHACFDAAPSGFATVFGLRGDHFFHLVVRKKGPDRYWRTVVRQLCPTGKVSRPIEHHPNGGFRPGERGRAWRKPLELGSWRGVHCVRHIEYRYAATYRPIPDDRAPAETHTILLRNGFHYLQVQADTRRLTITFARDYLERLRS